MNEIDPEEPSAEGSRAESTKSESPKIDEKLRQRLEHLVPDLIRRTFYAGLGAVFTTEEGIRKLATDIPLPKEVATFLIQQAQTTKDDLFRIVAAELRAFLENLNLNEELQRLLTSLSFEIKTEIRFIPNDQKLVKPRIKNKVAVRRKAPEAKPVEPEPDADSGLVELGPDEEEGLHEPEA